MYNKSDIPTAIETRKREARKFAEAYGKVQGRVPAVYVARISPRKWHVGWNYQPETSNVGDTFKTCHADDFTEPAEIVWIAKGTPVKKIAK